MAGTRRTGGRDADSRDRPLLLPVDLLPRAERRPLRDRDARPGVRDGRAVGASGGEALAPAELRAPPRARRAAPHAAPESARDRPAVRIGPMARPSGQKLIADNRRARHEYHLLDRYEAGVALTGTEVKSLRDGKLTLQRAYADLRGGELYLVGAHIAEYAQGNRANHDPDRARKLLLHRRELDQLAGQVNERGLTLVPTRVYFKHGRVKVEIAVARGKEARDKRRDIAERDARRQIDRELKARQRG